MYKSVAILGRQPKLGIAELESLYGPDVLLPYGNNMCLVDIDSCNVDFGRLGGSVRLATLLTSLPSNKWHDIENFLISSAPEHAKRAEGKLTFGLSVYGVKVSGKQVSTTATKMKKAIKKTGKSVRMVPHKDKELGSAVVLHNKLHRDGNWELLVISDGQTTYLAQTFFIQDIDAYSARDQARPKRDAKVGMLPPKLAQIIVNLSSDQLGINKTNVCLPEEQRKQLTGKTLLDPFCGTGVVLQEASLMGFDVQGTDIDPRMIKYSEANLKWLKANNKQKLEVADATKHKWTKFDQVACETFLGQPLSTLPPSDQLSKIMRETNEVNHKFLLNISKQLDSGTLMCVAVPTWRGRKEFLHLSAIDHLTEMGYTRKKFKHVSDEDLIYHREGQVVGRELLVLEKK